MFLCILEKLKKIESEYYCFNYEINLDSNSKKWVGKVNSYRKDTNEIIDIGFICINQDKEILEKIILDKIDFLKEELISVGVPLEWNSPIRPILIDCLKYIEFVVNFNLLCQKAINGEVCHDKFKNECIRFCDKQIFRTLSLTNRIECLSLKERINILISPDKVFEDPSDPWSIDDLKSRIEIFKFFLNPSSEEVNVHENQVSKLRSRYIELGWVDEDVNNP